MVNSFPIYVSLIHLRNRYGEPAIYMAVMILGTGDLNTQNIQSLLSWDLESSGQTEIHG